MLAGSGDYLRFTALFILAFVFAGSAFGQDADGPSSAVANPPAAAGTAKAGDKSGDKTGDKAGAKVGGWSEAVAPTGSDSITLDARQTKIVQDVSNYFSSLQSLQGAFVQIDAGNKRMKGKFFVKRPGRFRFDYAPPSKQVIISDGENLAIQDLDLNNEDRVSLDQTPFRLLLRKDVDLLRDAKITEVQQADDLIVLGIEDKDPNSPGHIKLFLATKPSIELKEWVTTDAQGVDTRIELSQLVKTDDLDGNLFKIQPLGPKGGRPN